MTPMSLYGDSKVKLRTTNPMAAFCGIVGDVSHEMFLETNLYGCFQRDGNYLSP